MSESSSQPPAPTPLRLRLGLLLLVALPCLPGLTFLLAGLLVDPHTWPRDPSAEGAVRYAEQHARARSLYLAGGSVLIVGTFGMAMVLWKITRPGKLDDEKPESASSGGDAG